MNEKSQGNITNVSDFRNGNTLRGLENLHNPAHFKFKLL